jgi:hypothetical protein
MNRKIRLNSILNTRLIVKITIMVRRGKVMIMIRIVSGIDLNRILNTS